VRLRDARIGYAGYSNDFSGPGDRRRFAAYARIRGIEYEYPALDRPYDLVLVTHNGDVAGWTERKLREGKRLRFVFELVDSYFTQTRPARRFLKGVGRYAIGMDSRLSPDFLRTLTHACEAADAVICSTEEQRETIARYNSNVFVSFDHFGDEIGAPKEDYARSGKLRVVWEGQSTTLPNLQVIREPLNDLKDKIELHVVTDPLIYRYFGRYSAFPAMEALEGIECDKHFHRWDRATFSRNITACDLAVIPIERSNALWWAKPENKLVLLWQLGMPVFTAATPVYQRVMDAAGIEMHCASSAEWGERLERLIDCSATQLEAVGHQCRRYADEVYSRDAFQARFDAAFESIGFGTG
jgi:hypothetical protein